MILEDELEDEVLLDVVRRGIRTPDVVAQKWKTGQWKIVLKNNSTQKCQFIGAKGYYRNI